MTSTGVIQQRTRRYLDEMDPDFRAELEEAFTLFDRVGDGQIDAQELSNLLRSLGQNPKREEVQQLVLEMDIDNSGSVDMEEFLLVMAKNIREGEQKEEFSETFAVLDKDQDTVISREDLAATMSSLGEMLTEQEIDLMMGEAGADDGKITLADFKRQMASWTR